MPTAPPSRCTDPECSELATKRGRCDKHQPIPWAGRDDKASRYGISSGTWRKLKRRITARDNGCCYRCGADQADTGPDDDPFVLDHIVPIAEGGSPTDLDNLGLLCPDCDQVKSRAEAIRGMHRARGRRR
ncbi:HNH endonuclease [Streptomyces sp. NEAU-Y11]|uniref:HNH endonuclease n=1 Tax=Streptomyces cucumeris TaxID=2962890 RepID=UPI0020C833D1|nr:HNH endonuclease signature motif containing protein [Streptomyces sp. NEAU-Y11]MCP9205513.1 HNH endonuclease [Streptomyces sp. NEAU-Y11]